MTTLLQGFCIWLETMNTYSGNMMNHMDTHQILSLPQLLSCDIQQVGWKASDLDLIEANEAFAAQALAVNKVGLAGEGRFERVHL